MQQKQQQQQQRGKRDMMSSTGRTNTKKDGCDFNVFQGVEFYIFELGLNCSAILLARVLGFPSCHPRFERRDTTSMISADVDSKGQREFADSALDQWAWLP